ncbi:MAG: phenylacetic acid degradation operon negative regulatory protein PaaX [Sedimenticola sp.]|uniref:Phenylacetic acid degradation operon negative regulatory protein PaaX n=1 Tax=Sedimenticola thiotaurini TaxID=1543721 RepID=A0A558D3V9_9GAMM|nr:phenylacetic acid degradation operon negative regulatory protein PaaX [Sedimenticola sp.]MCW8947556.1 phenylacetic acid degradation operon negative regulatory protein PaaX [Sedimenticola sp.]MCW8976311.1 phenylacetic acid degradation operon negative regulatory protein PaaX [Sedimenticola sp.]MDF1527497.1 PaaX family transcriptional regulator C-terminal domain-containing protein [Sedimenticola sp.]TVT55692.1 MAG: phenylacetic acid degradation operon negative regulatory protein PaaX [Sedimenti
MANNPFQRQLKSILDGFRKEPPSRTPSLVATLFGDVVESHDREIWLGSITALLEPFGVNERLVRTAVYRLAKDNFVESIKIGRKSYYRLTENARRNVGQYDQLIYYPSSKHWDGDWTLVFTGTQGINAKQRAKLRKELTWLGYGIIAPNVYGHPTAPINPTQAILDRVGVTNQVVVLRAHNYDPMYGLGTKGMVRQCFKLSDLEKKYAAFIKHYRSLAKALQNTKQVENEDPEHCFMLRIMLIHHYRRILLLDPKLPAELLPDNWLGQQAQDLCAAIYRPLEAISEKHILALCENQAGPFRQTSPRFRERFTAW